jgi:hypothetical protein
MRTAAALSPVRGGEGRGVGRIWNLKFEISNFRFETAKPLTLTLSPEYKGEGKDRD